jgi:hypothetical protein
MAAKAMVPVEALPCIDRFRGHGPLLEIHERRRRFRLRRFLAFTAFGAMAPSYKFTNESAGSD